MDMKQSLEIAVFVIAAIAIVASFFNMLTRERRVTVGYIYNGSSGRGSGSHGSSNSWTDMSPSPSDSHGGHHCSGGGSSGDGGSCGGGDGGGGAS